MTQFFCLLFILSLGNPPLLLRKKPMRVIRVIGLNDHQKAQEIRRQARFYLERLAVEKEIILMVSFVKFSGNISVDQNCDLYGTTIPGQFQGKPMFHVMIAKNLSYMRQKRILAHEMVHVQQFVAGRLQEKGDFGLTWQGQDYQDVRHIPYHERAWENEANHLQNHLVKAFIQFTKNESPKLAQSK